MGMARALRSCNQSQSFFSLKPVHPSAAPPMASNTIITVRATPMPMSVATQPLDRVSHMLGLSLVTSRPSATRAITIPAAHNTHHLVCLFGGRQGCQGRGLFCSSVCVPFTSDISTTIAGSNECQMNTLLYSPQRISIQHHNI